MPAGGSETMATLVKQLRDYPYSEHDDGPDGLELAMRMVAELAHV